MNKRIATLLFLVVLVGSSALADAKWGGIARQLAMGGSQAGTNLVLNPYIVTDPALMFLNPAYQSVYRDYAWMNVAGGTLNNLSTADNGYGHQSAGGSLSLSKEFTLGAILSYDPSAVNGVSSLIAGGTPIPGGPALPSIVQGRAAQTMPQVQNVFELLGSYGRDGMNVGFGATVGWAKNSSKTTTPTASNESEASAKMFGFRAGILYDLGGGSSFDAAAAIRLDKATDLVKSNAGSGGEYSASGTEVMVSVRAALKTSNKFRFVPYGTIILVSAEPKEDTPPLNVAAQMNTVKYSATAFAVGVGGEYKVGQGILAGGVSLQSAKGKIEASSPGAGGAVQTTTTTYTYTAIPVFNLGGEWSLVDWLAFRLGYYRSIGSVTTKTETPTTTTESDQDAPMSFVMVSNIGPGTWDGMVTLGVGVTLGNLAFDATVSEEALRRGFGLLGSADNINTFGYITLSYNIE
jgi:hypothetical protein